MNFPCSMDFTPPAPVVDIMLTTIATGAKVGPIKALVDTGADATVVPIDYLDRM